ncbi:MAG: hypothetical protein AAGG38_02110 [Planctomycetota bacterium]
MNMPPPRQRNPLNPLPPRSELEYRTHLDPDGYRWEVMHGDESIYLHPTPAKREATAERQAEHWLDEYEQSDARLRCRMCGYDWAAVKNHL